MVRRRYPEHELCKAIVSYWDKRYPMMSVYLFHIPNEGKMHSRAGQRLNEIGRRKGVADYHLMFGAGRYTSLYMEVKTGSNNPDANQQTFMRAARKVGAAAVVVWDLDEAIAVLDAWVQNEPGPIEWLFDSDTKGERSKAKRKRNEGTKRQASDGSA